MGEYIVRIILYQCTNLLAADHAITGGKSDPYVLFTIGNKTLKSSRIKNDLNPHWSPPEKFEFRLKEWEHDFIIVRVYDHDLIMKDDLIGSAVIPLRLFAGNRHNELYRYPLVLPEEIIDQPTQSDIHLQISLTTSDHQPVEYKAYFN